MATESSGTLPWIERVAEHFSRHSFVAFHRETIPALVATRGALVASDPARAATLAFRTIEGPAFTWHADPVGSHPATWAQQPPH